MTDTDSAKALREFALQVIDWAWEGYDPDGSDIQDLAEKHGLLAKVPYDPEKHNLPEWLEGEVQPGDDYYTFTDLLKAEPA